MRDRRHRRHLSRLSGPGRRALSLNTAVVTAAGTWAVAVMGGSAAQHNNFWQLLIRPAGSTRWKLVTPPGTADNGGLVLAGAGQALIAAFRPSQYLTYTPLTESSSGRPDMVLAQPGRRRARQRAGRAGRGTWQRAPARAARERHRRAIRTGRRPLEDPHQPAGPGRHARRAALRAAGTDRRFLHAVGDCPAWRRLRPAGYGGHLRGRERDLAGRRTCPARRPRPAGHRGPQAHPDGEADSGAAGGRHRPGRQPAHRVVLRQRRPLGTLTAAPAPRSGPDLSVVRTRRNSRRHPDRPPRRDHHQRRQPVAAAARAPARHGHAGPRTRRRDHCARRAPRDADRLAGITGRRHLDEDADAQRPDPVRIIRLNRKTKSTIACGQHGFVARRP